MAQSRDPFGDLLILQIDALLFMMKAAKGKIVYRLNPNMNEAGDIVGVQTGASLQQPLALLAFLAALNTPAAAVPIGDVRQIGNKVVIAAPLYEIFGAE